MAECNGCDHAVIPRTIAGELAVGTCLPMFVVLAFVVKYDNKSPMPLAMRPISWIKAARKDFEDFPTSAQTEMLTALAIAAKGAKADLAKPLKGFGSGVFEIALKHRGDAFRVVYAVQVAEALWVIHALQKKSKAGVKTPKPDLDLIAWRLKRLKEQLA